jgi:hypothetical protein
MRRGRFAGRELSFPDELSRLIVVRLPLRTSVLTLELARLVAAVEISVLMRVSWLLDELILCVSNKH